MDTQCPRCGEIFDDQMTICESCRMIVIKERCNGCQKDFYPDQLRPSQGRDYCVECYSKNNAKFKPSVAVVTGVSSVLVLWLLFKLLKILNATGWW